MDSRIFFYFTFLICTTSVNGNWGSPGSSQYHIQTDEGPERYFRYQTDNGQFRKEKRLQDGTVIGTDAWIDAFGYLRQKDYIADSKGYRILKSKTVFVGKNRPIQEAMSEAKNSSPQSGILVKSSPPAIVTQSPPIVSTVYQTTTTPKPITTTYVPSSTPVHPSPIAGIVRVTSNGDPIYPSSYGYQYPPSTLVTQAPSVETTYLPAKYDGYSTTTERPQFYNVPITTLEPPFAHNSISSTTPNSAYHVTASLSPFSYDRTPITASVSPAHETSTYRTPIAVTNETPKYYSSSPNSLTSEQPTYYTSTPISVTSERPTYYTASQYPSSIAITPRPPLHTVLSPSAVQHLNDELLPPKPSSDYGSIISTTSYRPPVGIYNKPNLNPIESSTAKAIIASYNTNNLDNNNSNGLPVYNRPQSQSYPSQPESQSYPYYNRPSEPQRNWDNYYNQIEDQPPNPNLYDGVSVTNNGFHYFLPRHYHEEENSGSSRRTGSYGYIDPFGIRRVVYYNTSPEGGFVHRKNNRYVGFNAAPYDPRPS